MSISTYSELKTAVANWLERDDLTSRVDEFIDLAEAKHKQDVANGGVRIREMLTREALTVANRYEDLPDGYLEAKGLRLLTDPVTVLDELNIQDMARVRSESTGKPTRFTIHEQIEFDKSPDDSYSGEILYYKELTPLSDANTTNALLTRAPGAYLYGALVVSAPFLMHDERIKVWEAMYVDAVNGVNSLDRKKIGPLQSRVVGATP